MAKFRRKQYEVDAEQIGPLTKTDEMLVYDRATGKTGMVFAFPTACRSLLEGEWIVRDNGQSFAMTDRLFREIYEPVPAKQPEQATPPRKDKDWDAAAQWNGPESIDTMKRLCGDRFRYEAVWGSRGRKLALIDTAAEGGTVEVRDGEWVIQVGDKFMISSNDYFLENYLSKTAREIVEEKVKKPAEPRDCDVCPDAYKMPDSIYDALLSFLTRQSPPLPR